MSQHLAMNGMSMKDFFLSKQAASLPMSQRKRLGVNTYAQQGGTTLGVIVGVVLGLAVALGVSLYLAYSGAPIQTKVGNNAARIEPPKDLDKAPDPNASLYTKVPKSDDAKEPKDNGKDTVKDGIKPSVEAKAISDASKPEHDSIGKIAALVTPASKPSSKGNDAQANPDSLLAPKAVASSNAGERYFVQAGAYANLADAEAMRAKLAIQGVAMTLSPRDKDGQILQRVRTSPMAAADAEKLRNTLKANGVETSLVKVQ